ncbi:hypothetical protein ACJX0J_035640, partial [Zea mays]
GLQALATSFMYFLSLDDSIQINGLTKTVTKTTLPNYGANWFLLPTEMVQRLILLHSSFLMIYFVLTSNASATILSNAGGHLIILSDGEAVEAKGLRDDTTCIVIDIISPKKPKHTIQSQRTPGKGLVLLKNFFLRKTTSNSLSLHYKNNYSEPDLEEVFEGGCPSLSR